MILDWMNLETGQTKIFDNIKNQQLKKKKKKFVKYFRP